MVDENPPGRSCKVGLCDTRFMHNPFKYHLQNSFPFLKGRLLLAVSGGVDSMVMAHLFRQLGFETGIAHCHFNLRGEESDADAAFVESYTVENNLPFHFQKFDTAQFAADFKLSIQVAARRLRYEWFHSVAKNEGYDFILTAHHADDDLETFLINLSRGTGLDGLTGIAAQNGKIVRPLLLFSRAEIEAYAIAHHIAWRDDSSNASDKYLRNKLRHHVVPALKEANPSLLSSFRDTLLHLQQAASLADDALRIVYRKVVTEENQGKRIILHELKQLPNYEAYLYGWLSPFGFTSWPDVYALVGAEKGKQVVSAHFRLVKDADALWLAPIGEAGTGTTFYIDENLTNVEYPVKLLIESAVKVGDNTNTAIFVDRDKLKFPLVLRRPLAGDVFLPDGMGGKSKKIGKFLRDEKLPALERGSAWLLCNGDEVVWVVGRRADERFKVYETTQNITKITLLQ